VVHGEKKIKFWAKLVTKVNNKKMSLFRGKVDFQDIYVKLNPKVLRLRLIWKPIF